MSTPNPNITPELLSPAPVSIPAGYQFAGAPPSFIPPNDPAYNYLANRLAADVKSMSDYNLNTLIRQNVPGSLLVTISYFYSVAFSEGSTTDGLGNPIGSLYELIAQNGASAYTPPVPVPINLKTVFALAQNNGQPIQFGDGSLHLVWTAGAGTTHKVGDPPFPAGVGDPDSSFMNPDGPQPPFGTWKVIQWGMGQAICSV